ncbi:class I adenylate-forming enzyme family protein [Actinomadura sp. WAC 06369]|uniref:class I adenylate-forming enzyme family protein n=1 Tax=Actinomadura sp. WAC 06369 TaxID=2203193 RepID=UPI000F7A3C3D|nr:AMP-binding protein [Actinomadura sp. WAC 06369]RSN70996.1 fatty-acid--CoA ligase [Actinomadura sp. WAC 06369]
MHLTHIVHRALQLAPDEPVTAYGDRFRTAREQADRVSRLAGALRERGVGSGEHVGMLALGSDRYIEFFLAVAWANGVFHPVNPAWSTREMIYALAESRTEILFIDDAFLDRLEEIRAACPDLREVVHVGDGPPPAGMAGFEELIAGTGPVEDARRGGEDPACVVYTSGTTGRAKGVVVSHAGLVHQALILPARVPCHGVPGGRILITSNFSSISMMVTWLIQGMWGGITVVPRSTDVDGLLDAIERHGVTHAPFAPGTMQQIVDRPDIAERDLSSMRSIAYGAAPITEALLTRVMKVFPNAAFHQWYGMNEFGLATLLPPEDHAAGRKLRSAGRPAIGAEVRIADETGAEVPRGEVGEILVRTGAMMLGYLSKPEETARTVRDGWLHTGDGGYMDEDGYLYIVDRIKDVINVDGWNVYSTEVEQAVASHPAVAAVAVIGVPDDKPGEKVHAVIVLKHGRTASAEDIRRHCEPLIAWKTPTGYEFVDALPLSNTGKVLKRELRKPHWAGRDRQVN